MKFLKILWVGFVLAVAASAPAATVSYIAYGSSWPYRLGTNEASAPDPTTWRTNSNLAGWSLPVATPIGYGDPAPATLIPESDAISPNWLCVFMRQTFVVNNLADVSAATLSVNIDDGYVVWINGTEVGRYNMPSGTPTFQMTATTAAEPVVQTHSVSPVVLRAGVNVIAIQSFNANLTSSDHYVDVSLVATIDDVPPALAFQLPYAGSTVSSLTQIEVDFTEGVTGVNAADLLINGVAATNVTATSSSIYVFRFPPPAAGTVNVQFAAGHGIQDLSSGAYPFAGGSWTYVLDPNYVPVYTVRINELLAINVGGLRDEDNEPQDWVELHNPGSTGISLAGWSLTDDAGVPDKWVFPSVTLGAGAYVVVFCSEKDRKPTTPGSRLHTNFKLNPDGEYLALYNAEVPRQVISSFNPFPNQRRDYSFGYDPGDQLKYFTPPTPGAPNAASSITGIVADTKFSVKRGFYTNAFSLSITCATPGVTIRYTLDGKAPTASVGSTYVSPLTISGTTVVRAFASKAGLLPSDIDAQTYLFVNDVITQAANGAAPAGWPASWGGNTVSYGMDPKIVTNSLWKDTLKGDLMDIPSFSVVMNLDDLFSAASGIYANPGSDGPLWERPCSIEMVSPEGEEGFQINCGIRLRGGFSRSTDNPKHALRFFFRQEYGASKLDFPFFGATGAKSFDKFDMRTMQNYSWSFQNDGNMICVRDVMSRDAQLTMNGLSTRGNFYHLYINGMYWGLYNSEERPEAAFAESYVGGREEDYDTIKQVDGYTSSATDGNNDAWYRLWEAATNGFASDANYFKVQGLNVDGTINTNYENLVDVPNLIDYMLVILYGGNLDAPISNFLGNDSPNNWYGFRDRTGKNGGFRFVSHDAEHTLLNVNEDRTGIIDLASSGGQYGMINTDWTCGNPLTQAPAEARTKSTPQYIWFRMHQNPEFRILAADRIYKHCFNGGPLSVAGMRSAFLARSNEIQRAIVAESARWGDAKNATPYTRNSWIGALANATGFINGRTPVLVSQLQADGLYPAISPPAFNSSGGAVASGFIFRMTNSNPSSTLYYSLDGTDPRLRGGGISTSSFAHTPGATLVINFPTTIRARVRNASGIWSALAEATLYPAQNFSGLLFSEIMFNPPALGATPGDELEFIEMKNAGTNTLDFTGIQFTDGVDFTFTNGTRLSPGQFLVLGRNRAALAVKYPGLAVLGTYTHRLNNGGEAITLQTIFGARILSVDYKAGGRWPVTTDGYGHSLVPLNPNSSPNPDSPSNWRASTNPGGSPGADDPALGVIPVVVNEALTHSDLPLVDYIELFNPGASAVDLGGWFLTDDRALPMKYRIPNGTMIAAGGYLVLDESHFNPTPGTNGSFSLDGQGEAVYLLSGAVSSTNLTGYSHGFTFDAAPSGASFGRHVISTGDEHFVLQTSRSMNGANAGPAVGPVVIRQIMYHPPDLAGGLDNGDDEYIELRNTSGGPVQFFDPAAPTNTWHVRGGVQYDFPAGFTLGAGLSVLLVSFDPADSVKLAAFRAKYGTFSGVAVRGPYTGQMDNSSDTIELKRPDFPTTNGTPYFTVDLVDYRDAAPWSSSTDGSGAALQRLVLSAYGNDPANWVGAAPLSIFSFTPTNISVNAGTNGATATNVTFTVVAVGTGALGYKWQKNGTDIPGATNTSYTILNVQLPDEGSYAVVVTDNSGSVVSPPAFLGVLVVPTFLQAPLSQTVVAGGMVTLSAVITGGPPPFNYSWNRTSVPQHVTDTSATTVFYTFAATNPPGTYSWRLVVKNAATVAAPLPSGVSHSPAATVTILADSDGDGLPDNWETANFGSATAANSSVDSDLDGMTNLQEYIAGTNPNDAGSYLRLDENLVSGQATLYFQAVTNRTYVIEYKDSLNLAAWTRLAEFPARTSNHLKTVTDPNFTTNRFYRLATPRTP